jgi:hypothetical protein
MKTASKKKLRAHEIRGMLLSFSSEYFVFLSPFQKHKDKKNLYCYLFFCAGVKLGLTLRDENRLSVFEDRILRRIFGPKREEVRVVIAQSA